MEDVNIKTHYVLRNFIHSKQFFAYNVDWTVCPIHSYHINSGIKLSSISHLAFPCGSHTSYCQKAYTSRARIQQVKIRSSTKIFCNSSRLSAYVRTYFYIKYLSNIQNISKLITIIDHTGDISCCHSRTLDSWHEICLTNIGLPTLL